MECVRKQMRKLAHLNFYPFIGVFAFGMVGFFVTCTWNRLRRKGAGILVQKIYVYREMGFADGARFGFLPTRDVQ